MTKLKMSMSLDGEVHFWDFTPPMYAHTCPEAGEQQQNVRDDLSVSSKALVTGGGTLCTGCSAAVQNYRAVP